MAAPSDEVFEKYFRRDRFPSIFCSGCGIGNIMHLSAQALHELGLEPRDLAVFSGIGCSGRIPGYFEVDGVHTTHGRALAFATGAKVANPDLNIIVFSGDGDCASIGGNHFIHSCRRNVDLTLIVVNNRIYGMTGGQVAPTTPEDANTTTTPFGNIEKPLDLAFLAYTAGASYVARWSTFHSTDCIRSIKDGLENNGFSFVEVLSPCPPNFGRRNRESLEDTYQMFEDLPVPSRDEPMSAAVYLEAREKSEPGYVLGILEDGERPEYTDQLQEIMRKV